jgi:SAM-dependent methyltransferase
MQKKKDYDAKFDTHKKQLLQIWDELQRLQTDLCFDQEISAYYMSRTWLDHARSVLDVGTGNGYFLNKIREFFPQKQYTGIDISKELISIGKSEISASSIRLQTEDYFDLEGKYDFIIMRLFWQHLPQSRINDAYEQLEKITNPGASVLISDAHDSLRCFAPPLKAFQEVISAYKNQQNEVERNRDIIGALKNWAGASGMWRVGCDLPLILPSTIPGKMRLYHRIYELWIELFENLGELKMDFGPAKKEISQWQTRKDTFTQAGIRVIRLDRIV